MGFTIAVPALWALVESAEERGCAPARLLAEAGIDATALARRSLVPAAERRIPVAKMHKVWATALREIRDPGFPLTVARRMSPDSFELFGFLIKTSDTLGDAFARVERYAAIWSDGMRFNVHDEGARRFIGYHHPSPPDELGARAASECVLAEVVGIVRAITTAEDHGITVAFEHRAPADVRAHEAYFGRGNVAFGASTTGLLIGRTWFDAPMPTRDPAMALYFEHQAEQALAALPAHAPFVVDVGRRIVAALAGGDATLERIARELGTSPRTLRRRLAEESETFEQLLARTRHDLARRYLQRRDLSLAEIALLLGFSDQTAFQRAFRRWSGSTPRAFRNRQAPSSFVTTTFRAKAASRRGGEG